MTETTAPAPNTALARNPFEYVVDRIWRFFCSVRAAIWEIAALAVLVLIGTLRQSTGPAWIADHLPFTEPIVRAWYSWDVFHSLPFILNLAVLCVAITICTLNRAPGIFHTIRNPTVHTSHSFLASTDTSAVMRTESTPNEFVEQLTAQLKAKRYRVMTETRGAETHLYADRNALAKLATFPFHLALILILVGGIVGAQWGFRETEFVVPEGSTREVGYGTGLSVELLRFTDTYTQEGMPHEYRSELVIYDNGEVVKDGSITVNKPISYDNTTFYQTSFGAAVQMRVTDSAGREVFADSIPVGLLRSALNSDAPAGIADLLPVGWRLYVIGPDEAPGNNPDADVLGLRSGEVFVQLRPIVGTVEGMPPSAVVAQGKSVELEGLTITFERERRFTLLQVAHNPGIPIFFIASFLLVGGLCITFYFPHRRVRAIIGAEGEAGARAHLAPLAKRDWSGQRDFDQVVDEMAGRMTVTVERLTGGADNATPRRFARGKSAGAAPAA